MSKTIQTHRERIRKGRFERSEIAALTKLIAGLRFAPEERKAEIEELRANCFLEVDVITERPYGGGDYFYCHVMHFAKPAKISATQTREGKEWLKRKYFKTNGQPRAAGLRLEENQGSKALEICKSVSRFEFVGVLEVRNSHGDCNQVLPIYRTYNRKGEYFDYSPIHWGEPVFSGGSNE
jgi:hypothetical protein